MKHFDLTRQVSHHRRFSRLPVIHFDSYAVDSFVPYMEVANDA